LCYVLFGLSLTLCIVVWLSNPGYLEKAADFDVVVALETFDSMSICPDCEVMRLPRCRHCHLCNKCVDRFDHHCPWVSNCIGRGNFRYFYSFVTTQVLYLVIVTILSWIVIAKELFSKKDDDFERSVSEFLLIILGAFMSFVSAFFLVSVM